MQLRACRQPRVGSLLPAQAGEVFRLIYADCGRHGLLASWLQKALPAAAGVRDMSCWFLGEASRGDQAASASPALAARADVPDRLPAEEPAAGQVGRGSFSPRLVGARARMGSPSTPQRPPLSFIDWEAATGHDNDTPGQPGAQAASWCACLWGQELWLRSLGYKAAAEADQGSWPATHGGPSHSLTAFAWSCCTLDPVTGRVLQDTRLPPVF